MLRAAPPRRTRRGANRGPTNVFLTKVHFFISSFLHFFISSFLEKSKPYLSARRSCALQNVCFGLFWFSQKVEKSRALCLKRHSFVF